MQLHNKSHVDVPIYYKESFFPFMLPFRNKVHIIFGGRVVSYVRKYDTLHKAVFRIKLEVFYLHMLHLLWLSKIP